MNKTSAEKSSKYQEWDMDIFFILTIKNGS